ncbi:hypothetical protein PBI_TOURACH_57 [Mycobacterium phage Tourach]|uniref:Uncharacterized protein n=1 Tax=Mycobacterium phage Tourach TaxID=2599882 RepID=A0A5J6TTZ5_9CAUD|nr:hypothetical protein J4T98_gp057 [Mycobacterium phage Tourach]QFG14295.1 hypothetical protein PBI_TOURACH_57 [Mycobacterium phage Tourach]
MPVSVSEAIRRYKEAQAEKRGETLPEKFYPVPNRKAIRAHRFGGFREGLGSGDSYVLMRPYRSRIQRGKSRPQPRGQIVRRGFKDYLENGPDADRGKPSAWTQKL